ncbi:hypothetical protein [Thermococcus stetteri]|uniref:hypothetical protein n=1 Tax=Thermococcus stetteri TaxID=49900 RepID=UPI001FD7D94A|nr:hypothetical protein [Thermococcus stetteri]
MKAIMAHRGQLSLEFMLIAGVMLIMLAYSVNTVTFSSDYPSSETLKVQVALEAKNVANQIAGVISQVYSQGPGSKAAIYVKTSILDDPDMLQDAFGSSKVSIYQVGNVVRVTIGDTPILVGDNKNTFSAVTLYNRTSAGIVGLSFPQGLPGTLKVVVEWNPDQPESWEFNNTTRVLRINIKPGGGP